jgi:uncharacterized UBP type Zn finger protein
MPAIDTFKSPIAARKQSHYQLMNGQFSNPFESPSSNHHFKLFAVVMHSGVSLNSGHYTAFVNYKIISERDNSNDFGRLYFFGWSKNLIFI